MSQNDDMLAAVKKALHGPGGADAGQRLLRAGHSSQDDFARDQGNAAGVSGSPTANAASIMAGKAIAIDQLPAIVQEAVRAALTDPKAIAAMKAGAAKSDATDAAQDSGVLNAMEQKKYETEAGHRAIDAQEHSTASEKSAQHDRLDKKHADAMAEYKSALKSPPPYDAAKARGGTRGVGPVAIPNPIPNAGNSNEYSPFLTTNRAAGNA